MSGTIFTHIDNFLATVTFSHPKSNSLPSELLQKLINTFERLDADQQVKVILLKSEGERSFCAGASFDELLQIEDSEQGKSFFSGFANLINTMRKCSKLIIGRAQGKSVGGGVGLLAACDYCFATETADIKLSELSIGIGPFVVAPAIERKMGLFALSELTLDAKSWKTAYWAQKNGLFNHIFESIREMDQGIEILVSQLCGYNPQALVEIKSVFWQGTDHWTELLPERAEISGKLVLSDFTKNALKKFKS